MSGGSGSRSQHPYARFAPPSTSSSLSSTSSSSSSSSWGRPSFSSATSNSLPGALGISHGQQEQHQHQSQPQTIPFGLPSASEISRSRSPSSNHHAARGHAGSTAIGGPAFYTMASDSTSSSLHSRPSYGGAPTSGIGGPASGSGAGAMGIAGTSSSRDFLVPIGSTGARQKLSILSPSQRRAAAGSSGGGESQYNSPHRGAGASTAAPAASAPPMGANNGTMSASSSASSLSSSSPYSVRQSMQSSSRQSPQTSLEERAPSSGKTSAGNGYHSGDSSNVTPPRPARSGQRHGSGPVSSPSPSSSQSHARADANANSRHALVYSPPRSGSPSRSPPSASYSSGSSAATTRTPGTSPAPHPYAPASRPRPSLPEDQRSRSERDSKSDADFFGGGGGGSSSRSRPPRSSQGGSESATSTPPARNRSVTPTQDSTTAAAGGQRLRSADLAAALRGDTQSSPYKSSSATRPTSSDGVAHAGAAARGSAQPSSYSGASYGSADTPATSSRKGDGSVGSSAGSISSSSGIKGRLNKMLGAGKSGAKPAKEGAVASDYGSEPKQYSSNDSLRGSGMGMRKTESSSSIKSSASQNRMASAATASSPGPAILPTSASSSSVGYGSAPGTASAAGSPAIPWRGNRSRSNTASSSAAASTYSDRDRDRGPASGPGASADSPRKAQHPRPGGLPADSDTASSRADQAAAAAAAAGTDSIDQRDTRSSDAAPELNLKSSDFADLQSMMPASYMGAGSRSVGGDGEGNGLLAASPGAAALLDKSLPPTPEPDDSPRTRSQVVQQQANAATATANASSSSATADAERRPSATPSTPSRSGSAGIISGAGVPDASASEAAMKQREEAEAARTYIPPGALSFNRKGVAVRDRLVNGGTGGLGVPESFNQSRFSTSTNDVDSVKSPSPGTLNNNVPTTPGTRLSLHSLENGNEDDVDASRAASEDRGSLLPASAWAEVEVALLRFKDASSSPTASAAMDKGALIRNVLLPFLALEAETPNLEVLDGKFRSPKARRALFFDWIANLLIELQRVQTSADRGAILESIACIIESRNLSPQALRDDAKDEAKFGSTFGHILLYAIGELNKKGVYQNTLIFSGRLLAVAFFRVAGVASKLLRALPINRFALERVAAEAGWEAVVPTPFHLFAESFPETLRDYCFYDARTYLKVLDAQTSTTNGDRNRNGDDDDDEDEDEDDDDDRFLVRQPEVQVEMTGNWLRRWQSDDSELFFSFCRSYHRQLAGLLTSTPRLRKVSPLFFGGPGYAHLATCIHLKCLSLVNRDILSVTTLSSQKTFNPGETANVLSGSTAGKPRHLEAANRRCTAIIVDLVRAPSGGNHVFVPMLGVHIKCLVKRTSLYDVQGVFCLLDWLDGVLGHMDAAELSIEGLVDIDFLITTLGLLLEKADHALALMRAIAFSYSNFAVLISTQEHRRRFCQEMLLKPAIFQKLFLSWSFTIRAYFLHLLVFRLARIGDFPQAQGDATGKTAVEIARVFNARLDEIRQRHEELSPTTPGADGDSDEEDGDETDAKSTTSRRPPSFVSTIRRTPSIVNVDASSAGHGGVGNLNNTEGRAPGTGAPNTMTKAERVLGIGVPDPVLSGKQRSSSGGRRFTSVLNDDDGMGGGGAGGGGGKSQSRAAKWLRALGGKKKGGGSNSNFSSPSTDSTSSFGGGASYDSPQISNKPRFKQMASLSELDFSDDDDEDEEEGEQDDEDGDGYDSPDANYDAPTSANNNGGGGTNAILDPSASASGSAGIDPTLHGDNIAMDTTFDLQSAANSVPPRDVAGGPGGAPGSSSGPGGPASSPPRMPRAFSKRTSILPGPAYDLVENGDPSNGGSGSGGGGISPIATTKAALVRNGYPESQHVYATQGLREWEAVLAEHDEFFATMADGSGPPAVPRLPVQWPAMWSD